jgi:cathepsin A (carboxypeptidase C)
VNAWSVYRSADFPNYSLRVKKEIKLCDPAVQQYAGYLDIEDRHFYFWFFESRSKPESDPVLLWLNGGVKCLPRAWL